MRAIPFRVAQNLPREAYHFLRFGFAFAFAICLATVVDAHSQPPVESQPLGNTNAPQLKLILQQGEVSGAVNQDDCESDSDGELEALLDSDLSDLRNVIVVPALSPGAATVPESQRVADQNVNSSNNVVASPVSYRIGDSYQDGEQPANQQTDDAGQGSDDEIDDLDSLLDSDVSQLRNTTVAPALQMEVSSVSRQKSTVGRSPAAVFVITQEMIHRSGARSIPELLRMVPGLHVGKVSSHDWAVSSRGFVDIYTKQLLVQIDGRSIYTPIFGGVVWSWHDLLLDDIERIEVIRGPGSTIWGANAVNGVINIITKSAADTHGIFGEAGGGSEERMFGGTRVGGMTPHGVNWRVSVKGFDRDSGFEPNGLEFDSWDQGRVNFRADWERSGDRYTFQGGAFSGENGTALASPFFPFVTNQTPVKGADLLFRWTRPHSEDSESSFQAWFDRYSSGNQLDFVMGQQSTFDLDFQNRFKRGRHSIIWGLGYRSVWDELFGGTAVPTITWNPNHRRANWYSAFVQDEIEICKDKFFFTIGTKLSHNDYSGFEVQPSARMLWAVDDRSVMWAAVSRAVRVPARTQSDITIALIPGLLNVNGFPDNQAEPLLAYEWGYRKQPEKWFSWDATIFYHDYEEFIASVATAPGQLTLLNAIDSTGYGAEISCELDMTSCWKLRAWYSFLHLTDDNTLPFASDSVAPRSQAFLMSTLNLSCNSDLDLIGRYIEDLRGENVPSYVQADLRYAWRPNRNVELSVVGQNLLNPNHLEFVGSQFTPEVPTQAERGVYGMIQIRY